MTARPLIDERLEGLLASMEGADSAELRLTVPDDMAGVVVRARRVKGRDDDTVITLASWSRSTRCPAATSARRRSGARSGPGA